MSRSQPRPLADVAHDLRHPLSTILLWEQIARHTDCAATRAMALDAIRQAALDQAEIIDRLVERRRLR